MKRELAYLKLVKGERAKVDPVYLWEATEKQAPFIESVLKGTKSENWFVAANRSGKSDAGAVIGATLARFGDQSDNPKYVGGKGSTIRIKDRATSGWVVSLDFPSSRDIIQPKYFDNGVVPPGATHAPFIPEYEIAGFNKSESILKLKNGSIIGFKSADSGRVKFQGTEKDWIHFDEEPPLPIYEESVIRVGASKLRIFGTCTLLPPEGAVGGVTWVYNDIIKPVLDGTRIDTGLFGASIYDNPFIPREEIARLESIYPEGSTQRRIRLSGEWLPGLGGSRAYPAFTRDLNVKRQEPPYERMPLCWVWDFNVEPMISLIGQRHGVVFRVYRELVLDEGSIPDMVDWFRGLYPRHEAEIHVFGDATGKGRVSQTGQSDYWTIQNHMKGYPTPLRLKVPEANPPIAERINAVNRVCKTETSESWLEIDPSCSELITDLEQVLRAPDGRIKKTSNKKDPYYRRTHTSDALGYWISREEPVRLTTREYEGPRVRIKPPHYGVANV